MANLSRRLAGNVPGKFYVDSTCIDCHLCALLAPGLFMPVDGKNYCVVC